jgi:tRNA(His) guanylyltransferase
MSQDPMGDRMKGDYEARAQTQLPRRTHTIIRIDGKAFHTYTRGLDKPYDKRLMDDMTETAWHLCQEIQGARVGYTQSDEISILLTDFATRQTQAWFDGNVQKIVSIASSIATAYFSSLRPAGQKLAFFDARVFTIPQDIEVVNYFLWRQRDATRNSISMLAQAHFSHKQLHGLSTGQMQELLWSEKGINWNDEYPRFKRGTIVVPRWVTADVTYTDKRDQQEHTGEFQRRRWVYEAAPDFGAAGARQALFGDEAAADAGE